MATTTSDRPRFRQDLVAEPIEDGGGKFIDVMDPDSGTLFRFYESEYSLACGMDGQRDVAGIVRWAEDELGFKPSSKEVHSVIQTLGELGYLESGAAAAATAATPSEPPARATPPPMPAVSRAPTPQPVPQAGKGSTSRWDQPTAMGESDQYLGKGVVTGGKQPLTPAPDVELGGAGQGAQAARGAEMPHAPSVELGAPGTSSQQPRTGGARPADVALGAPGRSANVDVDLAADMPVGAADVKEAVRQSQVMKSAEVPASVRAEIEAPKPRVEAKPVEVRPEPKPEPRPEPRVEAKPEPRPEPRPQPRAEERPRPAVEVVERAPTAPKPAVSPVLIAVLVLILLALGGLALYKFVFAKKKTTEVSAVQPTPEPPKPEPPPPPPAVETVKLATEQPAPEELKPTAPGQIATLVANDTAVKEGEPIAKFAGYKTPEAQVTNAQKQLDAAKTDVANFEKQRDAAQTAGNKNGVTAAEKKIATAQKVVTDQEAKLATAQAALDKLLLKAPGAGKVTAVAKANAKVTPTDVVATLTRDPALVGTFKTAPSTAVGTKVLLAIKGSDQKLSCTVTKADADGVKVACAKDAAPEGTEVTFAGVDPSAPPPGEKPAEAPKGETPEAPKGETPKGETPKGETPKGEGEKAETPKGEQKAAPPRPRPRPRPPAGSGDKGSAEKPAGEKPAGEKPAEGSAAPAGSGT